MRTPRTNAFYEGFVKRLNYSLQEKGLTSDRARSGVRIKDLAKVAGCSTQMANRYVNGEAMPDHMALKAIADWLEVSTGWLVYGETSPLPKNQSSKIIFDIESFQYVLNQILSLYISKSVPEITEFITITLNEIHSMNCDRKVMMQRVDYALKMIKHSQKIEVPMI